MPWEFYLHTGSLDMLSDNYDAMKEFIRYMQTWVDADGIMFMKRTGNDGKILKWYNLGEWVAPKDLPPDDMVHTFYFWRCTSIAAQTAKALGKDEESKKYIEIAGNTQKAFHKRFFDEKNGSYGKAGGNIFALKMGVPANQYQRVVQSLKADIKANKGHLDTGIFGTQFFFEVLAENGMNDLAFEAMNKKEKPGYGQWIELGSTTTREQWDEGGSHNHPMFGGGLTWFYRKLAGMEADPENPGYRHIIFRPQPAGDLTFVKYYNETSYGRAGITWVIENNLFSVDVTVPVGCTATLFIPLMPKGKITEGPGKTEYPGSDSIAGGEEGYRIVEIPSGIYHFVSS
jgi:alpha-L-rhamnosidase